MEQRTFTTARVVQANGAQTPQQQASIAASTQTIARGFPPELLNLIDHDPRFSIATLDGRWLDPYTGEAVELLKDIRTTALKRMSHRIDWRQRQIMGMNELAVRKHFFDLERVIPRDERLRIVDAATSCWINPYADRAESQLRITSQTVLEPETRLTMARILTQTPEMRNPIQELVTLLRPGRRVLSLRTIPIESETFVQPASEVRHQTHETGRMATAVFRQIPEIPGWDFGVFAQSCGPVGGDFYEIHPLPSGKTLVVLGDVCGHGMQGAQAATVLIKNLRRNLAGAEDLKSLAVILDDSASSFLPKGRFITLFLCLLDIDDGSGEFVICGHHRPLLIAPGKNEMLHAIGGPSIALGLADSRTFSSRLSLHQFQLRHGDWLVQCSDGIIEAQKSEDELFGLTRYAGTALIYAEDSANLMADGIADAAFSYGNGIWKDDATVLAIRRLAPLHSAH